MYRQSSEVPLAPCSCDKNKYGNKGRCDIWAMPGKWQQVSGGIAWRSHICYLVWGMLVDSWDSASEALFFFLPFFFSFFLLENRAPKGGSLWLQRKSSATHLKGIRLDVHLLTKRDVIPDVNADHDQNEAPLAIGSVFSSLDTKKMGFRDALIEF